MELSPQSKKQVDHILRFEKWRSWGVGIIGVSIVTAMLVYASYWEMTDSIFIAFLSLIATLVVVTETAGYRMWLRFVKQRKARQLLTFRFTVFLLGYLGLNYYGLGVLYQDTQPQSFQMFLFWQAVFWGAAFFGKWLDRIIQKHDGHYLTGKDLKLIREAREIEQEKTYG